MKFKQLISGLGALVLCAGLSVPASAVLPLPAGVGPINCKTMNADNIGVTADADGYTSISPFPPSGGVWTNAYTGTGTVDLPENGIICLRQITTNSGELKFNRNSDNTPVYILVEENIDMGSRYFNVDGKGGTNITRIGMTYSGGLGGPGGSDGGSCDFVDSTSLRAGEGIGPGGGRASIKPYAGGGGGASAIRPGLRGGNSGAYGGDVYSQIDDRLLHGGSGGGCGNDSTGAAATHGYGGSGGGGVLVVAAGTEINISSGRFLARGGPACNGGGAGGGGVVRLISPKIYGSGHIDTRGGAAYGACPNGTARGPFDVHTAVSCGTTSPYGGCGGTGLVKIEGYDISGAFLSYIYRTQGEFAKDANPDLSIRYGTPQPIVLATEDIPTVEIINVGALFDTTWQDQTPPPVDYAIHPYTAPGMYFRGGQQVTVKVETNHVPSNATLYLRMNAMDPDVDLYPAGNPDALKEIVGDGLLGVGGSANPKLATGGGALPTMFVWEGNITVPAGAEIGDIEAWVGSVCTPGTDGCDSVATHNQ